jgi:phosphohistidine phosphatase
VTKRLILVRHAKSDWPDGVPDHERPLADRGRRDARELGRWLAASGVIPEMAYVSSAARTRATFNLLAAELDAQVEAVVTDDVYGASTGDLLDIVRGVRDDVTAVLVVGHNPAMGMLASVLDDRQHGLLEFKTSAVAVFAVGESWRDVNPGSARLVASALPRG